MQHAIKQKHTYKGAEVTAEVTDVIDSSIFWTLHH